uniref:ZP domain-containing protein n=1 Tax=Panagrolaimus superbus TaxID=310955 RepID=A0A914Y8S7_9BILA
MLSRLLLLALTIFTFSLIDAFVDNGILGDPYVNCGADSIDVRFDTRNTFRGIVFVEDHLGDPECRSAPVDGSSDSQIRNASLSLGFKDCGIERRSSVSFNQYYFIKYTLANYY